MVVCWGGRDLGGGKEVTDCGLRTLRCVSGVMCGSARLCLSASVRHCPARHGGAALSAAAGLMGAMIAIAPSKKNPIVMMSPATVPRPINFCDAVVIRSPGRCTHMRLGDQEAEFYLMEHSREIQEKIPPKSGYICEKSSTKRCRFTRLTKLASKRTTSCLATHVPHT